MQRSPAKNIVVIGSDFDNCVLYAIHLHRKRQLPGGLSFEEHISALLTKHVELETGCCVPSDSYVETRFYLTIASLRQSAMHDLLTLLSCGFKTGSITETPHEAVGFLQAMIPAECSIFLLPILTADYFPERWGGREIAVGSYLATYTRQFQTLKLLFQSPDSPYRTRVLELLTSANAELKRLEGDKSDAAEEASRTINYNFYRSLQAIITEAFGEIGFGPCARHTFCDGGKFLTIWLQMQEIAKRHPDQKIDFLFFDDYTSYGEKFLQLFSHYPDLVPNNVTLYCYHFVAESYLRIFPKAPTRIAIRSEAITIDSIKGTGEIYTDYVLKCHAFVQQAKIYLDTVKGADTISLMLTNPDIATVIHTILTTPPLLGLAKEEARFADDDKKKEDTSAAYARSAGFYAAAIGDSKKDDTAAAGAEDMDAPLLRAGAAGQDYGSITP